jgi:hypothetical protein
MRYFAGLVVNQLNERRNFAQTVVFEIERKALAKEN